MHELIVLVDILDVEVSGEGRKHRREVLFGLRRPLLEVEEEDHSVELGNSHHYNQLLLPKDRNLKVLETVHLESVGVLYLLVKVILLFFGTSVVIFVEFSKALLSEQVVIT